MAPDTRTPEHRAAEVAEYQRLLTAARMADHFEAMHDDRPRLVNGPVLILVAAIGIAAALIIGHAVTRAWSEVNHIRMEERQ